MQWELQNSTCVFASCLSLHSWDQVPLPTLPVLQILFWCNLFDASGVFWLFFQANLILIIILFDVSSVFWLFFQANLILVNHPHRPSLAKRVCRKVVVKHSIKSNQICPQKSSRIIYLKSGGGGFLATVANISNIGQLSWLNVLALNRLVGGYAYAYRPFQFWTRLSTFQDVSSRMGETYIANFVFLPRANRSTNGLPQARKILSATVWFRLQSVLRIWPLLDRWSANTFINKYFTPKMELWNGYNKKNIHDTIGSFLKICSSVLHFTL